MFSKKYSEKYVKTLQEKNESIFEDLNNAYNEIDQLNAAKEQWAEQLESYEEKLIQRDLKISSMELLHEQLEEQIESLEEELEKASEGSVAMCRDLRHMESAYNNLNELLQKSNKSLGACGERLWELEEENSHLRKELEEAVAELNGCNPSKSSYPTVTINVDVRDVLAKQLAKSLKQVNEAFEKRYIFSCEGLDYSSDNRTKLARCIDSMYKLSLHDYASLVRLLESLEKELEHKDSANGGRSFYSNKLQERVFITLKATKEDI